MKPKERFISVDLKFSAVIGIIVILSLIMMGAVFYKDIENFLRDGEKRKLILETEASVSIMSSMYKKMADETLAVSKMPPIQGIVRVSKSQNGKDPLDGSDMSLWTTRLMDIFESVMDQNPHYVQMRYIGEADGGRELVRVNRTSAGYERVPEDKLQQKSMRDYFSDAHEILPNDVKFSAVNLNREYGEIERPYLPVVRSMVPVYDEDRRFFGVIIINASYIDFVKNALLRILNDKDIYVITKDGNYVHFDSLANLVSFRFEEYVSDNVESEIVSQVLSRQEDKGVYMRPHEHRMLSFQKLYPDIHDKGQYVTILYTYATDQLNDLVFRIRVKYISIAIFLCALASMVSVIFTKRITGQLKKISISMTAYQGERLKVDDIAKGNDEIAALARACSDLTEHLEHTLSSEREALQRLKAILDNTVDGIITINQNGTVLSYNLACEKIFGYRFHDIVGKNVKILMPEPYRREHDVYLRNYKKTKQSKIIGVGREVEGLRKNGEKFPLDLSVSEVSIQGAKIYSGIIRDISEKKKTEEELVNLGLLIEHFAYGIFIFDAVTFQLLKANQAARRRIGYFSDELKDKVFWDLISDFDERSFKDLLIPLVNAQNENHVFETKFNHKDGRFYHAEITIQGTVYKGSHAFLAIVRDIQA